MDATSPGQFHLFPDPAIKLSEFMVFPRIVDPFLFHVVLPITAMKYTEITLHLHF
jgi:hypothetical protein